MENCRTWRCFIWVIDLDNDQKVALVNTIKEYLALEQRILMD